jgi:hypothetical protein
MGKLGNALKTAVGRPEQTRKRLMPATKTKAINHSMIFFQFEVIASWDGDVTGNAEPACRSDASDTSHRLVGGPAR